jgi:hypothetical protein
VARGDRRLGDGTDRDTAAAAHGATAAGLKPLGDTGDNGSTMAESEKERVDRELIELLNELRVALPGVQVLGGFLLIVPFQQAFRDVTDLERGLYVLAFLSAIGASAMLIAPATYHRIRFRQGDKSQMLLTANRLFLAGMVLVGVSLTASSYLVIEIVLGAVPGLVGAIAAALAVAWFWFGLPLSRRVRDEDNGPKG